LNIIISFLSHILHNIVVCQKTLLQFHTHRPNTAYIYSNSFLFLLLIFFCLVLEFNFYYIYIVNTITPTHMTLPHDFHIHTCLICLTSREDDPSNNESVVLNTSCPTCKYYTHESCFYQWLIKQNKCVWCRNTIEEGYDIPLSDDDVNTELSNFDSIIIMNPFIGHSIHTNTIFPHYSFPQHPSIPIYSYTQSTHLYQRVSYYNIYNCFRFTQFIGWIVALYSGFLVVRIFI
jgi:hypothetical protein